jgi:3D (Asp-Asp-Asp) domain-containing protein
MYCDVCFEQYAATTGVFWTGTDDSGTNSESPWATTPHVIVAGGIVHVNSSDTSGLYKATDTIDILREVSSVTATAITSIALLIVVLLLLLALLQ